MYIFMERASASQVAVTPVISIPKTTDTASKSPPVKVRGNITRNRLSTVQQSSL